MVPSRGLLPLALILLLAGAAAPVTAQSRVQPDTSEVEELPPGAMAWARTPVGQLEGEFLRLLTAVAPVRATLLGLHDGDATLGMAGAADPAAARRWRAFLERARALEALPLGPDDRLDLALLVHEARWRVFELDILRSARRDPGVALSDVANGLYGVLARDYAPLPVRARALDRRLREVPGFLEASGRALEAPPRILVEQALSRAEALTLFLLDELPAAIAGVSDTTLAAAIAEDKDAAVEAVWKYRRLLADTWLPRARGEDFAWGDSLLLGALRASEGIDLSLDTLRETAESELDRLDAAFRETAGRIDPDITPEQVLARLAAEGPTDTGVLTVIEDALREAQAFTAADGSVPLDPVPQVEVRASPRGSRWASATLAYPGPFESGSFPAIFYITVPDGFTSEPEREESLRFLSVPLLHNLAVHEGFPGHVVQAAALRRVLRPARRAVWSTAFVEGWAHYAESLALERGYRAGDDGFALSTLQSGLRRAARFRVALGLHTEGWSLDRAEAFLIRRAYLESTLARREAIRGAVDPLYLVYTLGRLQIESLRDEVARIEGSTFDPARFHRRLLALGAPPLPLARARLLLPETREAPFLD
jgi:uncharacterized protein (DUF885 family)